MSRFNRPAVRTAATSPVATIPGPARTHEGGVGYARDPRGELFLLAVTNLVGQRTFYEAAETRDDRFTQLVRHLAVDDPVWTAGLLGWLRGEGNLRTAALVGAAEAVHARLEAERAASLRPGPTAVTGAVPYSNRRLIASVLQRADEPGELLAYWRSRFGARLPQPVKRGVADAVQRLYTERSLLKYDTASHGFRFGDVLELVHARPAVDRPAQGDLFKHAIDRRHGREGAPAALPLLVERERLAALPVAKRREVLRDPERLSRAGMTWEALAGWLQGPMDAAAWEAVIPAMGYMALLRNLRNFDQAGVRDEVTERVAARLGDPEEVARSRQLPMRFYSAYKAAPSLRWGHALEKALAAALSSVPELPGRTLVLVDTSTSMQENFSKDGTVARWDAAALFGIALGQRCASADVVSYSSARYYLRDAPGAKTRGFPMRGGEALLRAVERWDRDGYFLGGGTDTAAALREQYRGHDRVVIVTDEQSGADPTEVDRSVPATVPMYTWNLAGYERGHAPLGSPARHAFGGLTDAAFRMIPLLERGRDAAWPWEG
ncbi:TROVE domain-containing protein [Streptomyces sp. SPB074]|uniref:TROVE domain-containing protein n=1 Tax=Streptomyces sp. (strain SPB074) TaxID=465543 RepID=UPI00017F1062|nr:TROVE domain-containing protein [Streptomyces sp. SPB074]EDY43963.1 TROVE domain-containing protein [Streptomyces sp. SPB074]